MKKNKFKKLVLLQKDMQDLSPFKIVDDDYWEEIEFDAVPLILERIKKTKDKYIYSISIYLLPGMYTKLGEIDIPIDLNEDFLKIFIYDLEEIKKIEQILHIKAMTKVENILNDLKSQDNND